MKVLTYQRANALAQLHDELIVAFPQFASVMRVEGRGNDIILTVPDNADEGAIAAIVAAHVPRPTLVSGRTEIEVGVRTTNATPTDLFRRTLAPQTAYAAQLRLVALDMANGAMRRIRADVTAKRLNGAAILVDTVKVIANHQEAASSTWDVAAAVSGNDFVIRVTGAAGRTIEWRLSGDVERFAPAGLTD